MMFCEREVDMKKAQEISKPVTRKSKGFSTSKEAAKKRKKDLDSGAGFFKIPEGDSTIRILPTRPDSDMEEPFVVAFEHWLTKDDGTRTKVICPKRSKVGPCPICEHADALSKTGNPLDRKEASKLWPKFRGYFNVIVRDENLEEADLEPKIMGVSKILFEDIMMIVDKDGDPTDPENGFDIHISRKGTGMLDTEYRAAADRQNSLLAEDSALAERWIEEQAELLQQSTVLGYEEIVDLLSTADMPRETPRKAARAMPTRARQRALPQGPSHDVEDQDDEIPF